MKLVVYPVSKDSYKVRVTKDPEDNTITVFHRLSSDSKYHQVIELTSNNWEGVLVEGLLTGHTYTVLGVVSEGTVLTDRQVTLTDPSVEGTTAMDDIPEGLFTGSIKQTIRYNPAYRSESWKQIYGDS